MNNNYINFDRDICSDYQHKIDLFSRFILNRTIPHVQTPGEILEEEISYIANLRKCDMAIAGESDRKTVEDKATENLSVLEDLHSFFIGMKIVSIYHFWENLLKQHLSISLNFYNHNLGNPETWVWDSLMNVFSKHGVSLDKIPCYNNLYELMLVSNTIKHGQGKSYDKLKELYKTVGSSSTHIYQPNRPWSHFLGVEIHPTIKHMEGYISATREFWDYSHWERFNSKLFAEFHAIDTVTPQRKPTK